jgi:3-dehydroquinate dehydratase-1
MQVRAASAANGIALVLSHHNFECTPDLQTLLESFARGERLGADVVKLAVMPVDPQDVLTLLGATYQASQTLRVPLISMSMGGLGAITRIAGWQYGSAATFAVGKSSSAPGQLAVEDLREMVAGVRRASAGE